MEMPRLGEGLPDLLAHMAAVGYADSYVKRTGCFARKLIGAAPALEDWDAAREWADGLAPEGRPPRDRTYLAICRQYEEEGVMPRSEGARRHEMPSARGSLCAGLAAVLDAYEASAGAARKRESSVRVELSNAASFLARLEALGVTEVAEVTEDDVLEVLTDDEGSPVYGTSHVKLVRAVLLGASDDVEGCARLASLLPTPKKWRKVQPALTPKEAEAVAAALLDGGNGLSLRDRAIVWALMLTGLRASDVAALTKGSIDWRRGLISNTQQKTGEPLEIPLPVRLGNAIFEYVTRERGGSDDPHVFLSRHWPHGRLATKSLNRAVNLALDAAGVRVGGPRGTHIFRRAAITAMLGAGEDRAVVAAVAGHRDPATTDSYMVASIEGLRRHASLDVSRFAPEGGGDR